MIKDPSQKKALGNILKFMALVLIFTLIARGTAGATLAKVDTVAPSSGEIVMEVSAIGIVQSASSTSIEVPAGLTIQEVLVVPGQSIKAGDAIARLNTEEVAENRERAQLALDEMNLNLQKLERDEAIDSSALTNAQNALAWAEQDYANTQNAGNAAIAAAQTALTNAQNALTTLHNTPTAPPSDAVNPDDSAALPVVTGPSPAELAAAEAAVTAAQTALDNAIRDADVALQAAARAVETARINLTAAQQADTEVRQGAADTAAQNALDAEALRLDIEKQQETIDAYDVIQGGTVIARTAGIVLEVVASGTVSGENPVARISNASGGYLAYADIHEAEAEKLQNGAQVDVSTQQGYYSAARQSTGTLLSMSSPNSESMVSITVRLSEGEWKHGQTVQLDAIISREQYQSCVPLSALGQSATGYFVYVMEERSGVLGVENVAQMVPVTLLADNGSLAAIEGGLSSRARVISWTSKPLADGDKVRVRQP